MKDRFSTVKDIAAGVGLAAAVSGALLAATQGTGTATRTKPDFAQPCCAVVSLDFNTGTLTAKVTATGKTFTLTDLTKAELGQLKVGAPVDLACAVPPSGGTGATGNAASSGGTTTNCGSNVPRGADTRPKDCVATNSAGQQIKVACPPGVPIKQGK